MTDKMTDKTKQATADRRNFIKLAGASAAGAGATVATAGVAAATPAKPADDAQYRETAHVKHYYATTR
jgi:hypothetical protein